MDYPLGQEITVPIRITDNLTGAPVRTGGTVGNWFLYGPLSATVLVSSSTADERGNGVYSITLGASLFATPGTYRLVYSVTFPTNAAVANAEVAFTVGPVVRGAWRMRDLLASIIRGTGGSVRPSTLVDGITVVDPYWSDNAALTLAPEAFTGTEVVIIDPSDAATYADWPIGRVIIFTPATGTFTLNRTTGIAADASKRQYALTNVGGTGFMFEHLLEELQVAYDEVQPVVPTSLSVGVSTASNQLEYTLPNNLVSLSGVSVREPGGVDLWDSLAGSWEYLPDRRLLRLNEGLGLGANHSLRIEGAVRCELPRLGGGWTDIPGAWLRERVRFGLLSSSPSPAHQRTAQVVYANLLRMPIPHRPPQAGEVLLT